MVLGGEEVQSCEFTVQGSGILRSRRESESAKFSGRAKPQTGMSLSLWLLQFLRQHQRRDDLHPVDCGAVQRAEMGAVAGQQVRAARVDGGGENGAVLFLEFGEFRGVRVEAPVRSQFEPDVLSERIQEREPMGALDFQVASRLLPSESRGDGIPVSTDRFKQYPQGAVRIGAREEDVGVEKDLHRDASRS